MTAYQLLHLVGQVQAGDRVLVHAAGSGVGTAAVQLVKRAGARCLVTAGSGEKLEMAVGLGAERGVNYKTEKFGEAVKEWSEGRGVDVILDCVGGSYAEANVASLAVDGRLVEGRSSYCSCFYFHSRWVVYGLMGGAEVSGPLLGALLRKRASIRATTLRSR